MQLALSTTITPPSLPVWDELSGNLRQGFTTKNQGWNPGPDVVNSTTQIGLRASLFLEGVRQSHSARYYNPTTGRFMSRDPEDGVTTDPASLHKYLYAEGDPTNRLDRSGRDTSQEEASITIAVPENPAVIAGEIAEAAAVTCVLNKAATTLEGFTTDLGSPITKVINLPCATKVEHECHPGIVYRIYGGRSPLWGASWTYTPPGEVPHWYIAAGVGGWNTKLNIAVGDLVNPEGCTCGQAKGAYDLDGTWLPGNGTDEVSCPNPQSHINLLATGKTGKGFGRD